jgi:hypothetical protein
MDNSDKPFVVNMEQRACKRVAQGWSVEDESWKVMARRSRRVKALGLKQRCASSKLRESWQIASYHPTRRR